MSGSRERILSMVESGRITAAEGEELLAALQSRPGLSWRLLYDPFSRLSLGLTLALAVVVAGVGVALALALDLRFDGLLDLHIGGANATLVTALLDQGVAWVLGATVLWLGAWLLARPTRWRDVLAGVGLARAPLLVGGLAVAALFPAPVELQRLSVELAQDPAAAQAQAMALIPGALVTLLAAVWFVTLLVFALRHASGLRGGRLALAAVPGILVGEIVTKIVIHSLG